MAQILDPKWIDATAGDLLISDGADGMKAIPRFQTLVDGESIAWDMNLGWNAVVTLGGSRTLANPTNLVPGSKHFLIVKQDETGGYALAFGNAFLFPGGTGPTISTAAGAMDVLPFVTDGEVVYYAGDLATVVLPEAPEPDSSVSGIGTGVCAENEDEWNNTGKVALFTWP